MPDGLNIRWLLAPDVPAVLAIEQACFADPWDREDLTERLQEKSTIGHAAEYRGEVAAFWVYTCYREHYYLHTLAVDPALWGRGIGRAAIEHVKGRLRPDGRVRILMDVAERNVDAQLFLRACGLVCTGVVRDKFVWIGRRLEGQPCDAYRFAYLLPDAIPALLREEAPCPR